MNIVIVSLSTLSIHVAVKHAGSDKNVYVDKIISSNERNTMITIVLSTFLNSFFTHFSVCLQESQSAVCTFICKMHLTTNKVKVALQYLPSYYDRSNETYIYR